jgi:hypothetical protein
MDMENRPVARIGSFFILLGSLLLILFVSSVISKGYNVLYLLLGVVALFLGFSLRRRAAPPPIPSTRFSTIRKIQERSRKRQEAQQQKKERPNK